MKRAILWAIGLVLVIAILAGAAFGTFVWRFSPNIPEADYPAPANAIEARQQDLDYLRKYPEVDKSFSQSQLATFNALMDELETQAGSMTEAEFIMGISAAGAVPENGHSGVSLSRTLNQLNSLPVRFAWFGDGLHIVRARAEHAALIGSKVLEYDGQPPEQLWPKLDRYFGGNEAFLRQNSALYFAAPAALHAVGLIPQADTVTLTLRSQEGLPVTQSLNIEQKPTEFFGPSRAMLAQPHRTESESGHDWQFLDPAMTEATWYGRNPERALWSDELDFGGTYWRMRDIIGDEATPLPEWLEEQANVLRKNPANYLVLDLRANWGGDYTRAMDIARNVGELVKPDGRVYILTDGDTFSAGIVTAYFALHGAGDRAILVGEPMGDNLQFWAEGGGTPMRLPNSDIPIYVSTGYHDWGNGCTDWSRCFWINILFGVAVGEVTIDMPAPLMFADYANGIDSGMKAILAAEAHHAGSGTND